LSKGVLGGLFFSYLPQKNCASLTPFTGAWEGHAWLLQAKKQRNTWLVENDEFTGLREKNASTPGGWTKLLTIASARGRFGGANKSILLRRTERNAEKCCPKYGGKFWGQGKKSLSKGAGGLYSCWVRKNHKKAVRLIRACDVEVEELQNPKKVTPREMH